MEETTEQLPSPVILGEGRFTHTCLKCKVVFRDSARNTRFCTKIQPEKQCQPKYAAMRKSRKKEYDKNAPYYRVKSQCHSLAQAVLALEVLEGRREQKCECNGCEVTDIAQLEVHHRNVNIFDCRPENLGYLCKRHHTDEQSFLRTTDDTERWYVQEMMIGVDIESSGIDVNMTYLPAEPVVKGPYAYNRILWAFFQGKLKPEAKISRGSNKPDSADFKPLTDHKEFDMRNQFVRERIVALQMIADGEKIKELANSLDVVAAAMETNLTEANESGDKQLLIDNPELNVGE